MLHSIKVRHAVNFIHFEKLFIPIVKIQNLRSAISAQYLKKQAWGFILKKHIFLLSHLVYHVIIQNHLTHIRKSARYSCFVTATQLILLICVGGLYSSHLENKKNCCLHASMTHQLFLFSVVLNSYCIIIDYNTWSRQI